jgi:hypothetical protein
MTKESQVEEVSCDLCILGAGIAGLNALFAATRYLSREQKVVLVDRNAGAGGMWNSAYDYVRLHQPHPLFTAGNIPWTAGKDPSYLAARGEVVAHLRHCLETARQRITLDARFGYEYRSHDEAGAGADAVVVDCVPTAAGAPALRIKTKRLIKAFGYDVKTNPAIALSSGQVRSVSPDHFDLLGDEMRSSDAPVYIVGAGKTGMDTAYTLITTYPGKKVSLLIGEGTMFGCRDKLYPAGTQRWWTGTTPITTFLGLAREFNGRNELEVLAKFRASHGISLVPNPRRFMLGLLSEHENEVIARGSHEIIQDYLTDVVDRDGRPTMLLRSGASRAVEPGSWFVNCTGYFYRNPVAYEPYLSPGGKVLSIQATSAVHVLTTHAAYLLVHLWYRDHLQRLPLYELNIGALYEKNRDVLGVAIAPHGLYNSSLVIDALPQSVMNEFGVDLMRWYPAPRRLIDGLRFVQYLKRNPDHMRRALDVIRERFDIPCGPLPHVAQA